jgi:ATP-dependent exoDNAse (exonuclease V) alpha subunit
VLPTLHTAQGHELDAGQRDVILGFLRSPDAVNLLDAGPGTGKTDSMAAYGRILTEHGQPVTWLGTTGTATEELIKGGLPATTVASFLLSEKAQGAARGGRVVVDEVSMLGHADAYKLFRLAEQYGFRLDFVGDSQQHKSPVAGDVMKLMRREAGVRTFELTDIKRQQGEYKAAVEAIRRGDLAAGHRKLKEQGFVHEVPQAELFDRAAELYVRWAKEDGYVPVATLTHVEADALTERIRARLKRETIGEGKKARPMLPEEERPVVSYFNLGWSDAQIKDARKHGAPDEVVLLKDGAYRKDLIPLAVDDLVRVSMGGKTKDGQHKLTTGRLYHIGGFDKDGNPVLAENGWVVDKAWGGLRHGYVGTSQAVQGKTSRRAIAVYGEASLRPVKRPGFYVPITRAKKELAVLTSDEKLLAERIQRREERMTPTEAVGRKPASRRAAGTPLVLSLQKYVARLHELARVPAENVRPIIRHREDHQHAR